MVLLGWTIGDRITMKVNQPLVTRNSKSVWTTTIHWPNDAHVVVAVVVDAGIPPRLNVVVVVKVEVLSLTAAMVAAAAQQVMMMSQSQRGRRRDIEVVGIVGNGLVSGTGKTVIVMKTIIPAILLIVWILPAIRLIVKIVKIIVPVVRIAIVGGTAEETRIRGTLKRLKMAGDAWLRISIVTPKK